MSLQTSSSYEPSSFRGDFFTPQQLQSLDMQRLPSHVAIIMDGNRRWAMKQGQPIGQGHYKGAKVLIDTVKASKELGVKTLTVFGLSTENMDNRGDKELETIFHVIVDFLSRETPNLVEMGIRLFVIGDRSKFSDHLNLTLDQSLKDTQHCADFNFVVALNYGGRNEMIRAMQKMVSELQQGKISSQDITEKSFSQYLDTHQWPDPDLLIRTSGEQRLSNFLLWQVSYTEFFSLKDLWPDFSPESLLRVLIDYQKRERRLGD